MDRVTRMIGRDRVRIPLDIVMEPQEDTESLRSQITNLNTELDLLRSRYDTLSEAHKRAGEHYKADFKRWRNFKEWLFGHFETDDQLMAFINSGELAACIKASVLGKRKHLEEHAEEGDDETKDPPDCLQEVFRDVKHDLPGSSPTAITFRTKRRKSYHGESSHRAPSPPLSGHLDPFLVQQPTNHDSESSISRNSIEKPCKAESSRAPLTEPRKRRGRYAQVPSRPEIGTINSRFSIRKDKNKGVEFQYDDVVRNREERKHMLGSDCECCREYYEAVGPLPASRQPLWRTPTKCKKSHSPRASDDDKENTDEMEKRKQLISRHRHHWHRAKTPPNYWDIGFPDTQEVLDINRRAAEMHKRKLVEVESEARNNNGRYVERAPRSP